MMANSSLESDEAFARHLQAQEMGIMLQLPHSAIDAQTPLMVDGRQQQQQQNGLLLQQQNNRNPTVINARLNELSTARATVCAILTVNTPQIIAAIIILSIHWNDPNVCDEDHATRWKYWAAMSAFRMLIYSIVVFVHHVFRSFLEARPNELAIMTNIKNFVDAFGLIWFIVGNMWLFGDDELGCRHPERSPVYNLCVSMLIINYVQICLPCIVAVMMIPIFCFCMPCLIRVLARLHDPRTTQGATEDIISTLPLVVITREHLQNDDNSCPICLNELVVGEEARILQCKHIFHKQCVDEWLRVNATCPTCRTSVIAETANPNPLAGGSTSNPLLNALNTNNTNNNSNSINDNSNNNSNNTTSANPSGNNTDRTDIRTDRDRSSSRLITLHFESDLEGGSPRGGQMRRTDNDNI